MNLVSASLGTKVETLTSECTAEPTGCIGLMPVWKACTQRLRTRDRPSLTWRSRSWHPYRRKSFRNKIWQLLFSWPEFGVFINGPTVKGFSEPDLVFRICRSLVGAACDSLLRGQHYHVCAATLWVVSHTRRKRALGGSVDVNVPGRCSHQL